MDIWDKEAWEFINTFAPWLSAIGTLAVVIVSLYLARRDKTIRLEVSAGHRLMVVPGQQIEPTEWLMIRIINIGHREAQITNVGWKVGFFKKQHAIQMNFDTPPGQSGISSPIPVRLKDGEEANYYIPLKTSEMDWIREMMIDTFLQPHPKIRSRFLKIQAFTSVGNVFQARTEKGLRKKILEEIKLNDS